MCPDDVASSFQTIVYEKQKGIGYVTLNRPKVLNIYNLQMRDDLYAVLSAIKDDPEVLVAVFQGAGERAFCAGADLSEFLTAPSPVVARRVRWERDVWGLFLSLPQPLIAALHGYVFGSGIEIALCCDFRIASEDAVFGLPEASLGFIPAAGGTQTLPRTIGRAKSLDMMLNNRRLNAGEALSAGMINKVVSREELLPTAEMIARGIISRPHDVVRGVKEAVKRGADMSLREGMEMERLVAQSVLYTDYGVNEIKAFPEGDHLII